MSILHLRRDHKLTYAVIIITLVVGTLDGAAAMIWSYAATGTFSLRVFKFIASGLFGKKAYTGGHIMILWGLLIHYYIALTFSFILLLSYPFVRHRFLSKYIVGFVYAIGIWVVMDLIIVPISHVHPTEFVLVNELIALGILVLCVGMPISLLADHHFIVVKHGKSYLEAISPNYIEEEDEEAKA